MRLTKIVPETDFGGVGREEQGRGLVQVILLKKLIKQFEEEGNTMQF